MSESNKNPILNWTWEKPTEEGLYLACRGDVETQDNIQPFKMVEREAEHHAQHPWPTYNPGCVASWHSSFKFAKLCVGKEAQS